MDQTSRWLLVIFLSVGLEKALDGAAAQNPGFKIKLTQRGLTFGNNVLVDLLVDRVMAANIEDLNGKDNSMGITYSLTQLKVKSFPRPSSSATIDPGKGLTWRANRVKATLGGRYSYKTGGLLSFSDNGNFDVALAGVSVSLRLRFDKAKSGNPTVEAHGCTCSIGSVDANFNSFLINLFAGFIEDKIKILLQEKICVLLTNTINKEGSQKLADISVFGQMSLGNVSKLVNIQGTPMKDFMLDNTLVQKPTFERNAMETHHKGQVYLNNTDKVTSFVAPSLSGIPDSSRMVYLQLSTYVLNTLLEAAHQHGLIVYSFTRQNVPPNFREFLKTTCPPFQCIGSMIPAVGRNFPDSSSELQLQTAKAPSITINNNTINLLLTGEVTLSTRQTNGAVSTVFTLLANGVYNIKLAIINGKIQYDIVMPKLKLSVRNSTIGPIDEEVMRLALEAGLKQILEPKLNEYGSKGIPISTLAPVGINLALPAIFFDQNSVTLAADVEYTVGGGKQQFLSQILL